MNRNLNTDPISNWAKDINDLLFAYRKISSSSANHSGVIGESREFFIREILRRFIPSSVNIGCGQIIDVNDNLSKQIDIIISRPDFPVLTSLAKSDTYYVESVIATLEVKSNLSGKKDKSSLWKAMDNCVSVKRCEINYSTKGEEKPFDSLRWISPSSYIFSYYGYKTNLYSLKNSIADWIKSRQPSFLDLPDIIVTEGCVVVKNDRRLFGNNSLKQELGYDCIYLASQDNNGLNWLIYHLLNQIIFCMGEPIHARTGIRYMVRRNHLKRIDFERESQKWGKWDFDRPDNHDSGIIEF